MRFSTSVVTILVVVFASSCLWNANLHAEISPAPNLHGFRWRKSIPTNLLSKEALRREIGLSDESFKQVNDFRSQLESDAKLEGRLMGSVDPKVQERWAELLTPEQKHRLDQIHLQKASILEVFSDEEVIKELGGFTEKQQQAIHGAHRHYHVIKESFPNKLRSGVTQYSQEDFRRIVADKMKENEIGLATKLMNALTPEQREKLEALKGRPFNSP